MLVLKVVTGVIIGRCVQVLILNDLVLGAAPTQSRPIDLPVDMEVSRKVRFEL